MTQQPLDSLLEKLCSGDPAAAERVFLAFEPYLRMVVRKKLPARLRAKFDSMDVVQSVWADVLRGFREAGWRFADEAHLRAFLVKLTRHRFIDQLRRHRTAVARERPLGELCAGRRARCRGSPAPASSCRPMSSASGCSRSAPPRTGRSSGSGCVASPWRRSRPGPACTWGACTASSTTWRAGSRSSVNPSLPRRARPPDRRGLTNEGGDVILHDSRRSSSRTAGGEWPPLSGGDPLAGEPRRLVR